MAYRKPDRRDRGWPDYQGSHFLFWILSALDRQTAWIWKYVERRSDRAGTPDFTIRGRNPAASRCAIEIPARCADTDQQVCTLYTGRPNFRRSTGFAHRFNHSQGQGRSVHWTHRPKADRSAYTERALSFHRSYKRGGRASHASGTINNSAAAAAGRKHLAHQRIVEPHGE